jgi:hypothetical protein
VTGCHWTPIEFTVVVLLFLFSVITLLMVALLMTMVVTITMVVVVFTKNLNKSLSRNRNHLQLLMNIIVTCQPSVGLRNRALLGSRQLNASRPSTRCSKGSGVCSVPCRAVPCRAEQNRIERCYTTGAMTSYFRSKGTSRVFTWLPGDEPPSCQTARGVGDVT